MAEQSIFRGVIEFFADIGIYDVVLPFLLVFTMVFAIFEKTRVFGTDEIEGKKYTKKNLDAMVAFVIAFFVVASKRLVDLIQEGLGNIVILLLMTVCFLVLVGSFFKESEDVYLKGGWRAFFMVIMFIGVVLIFLHAIKTDTGESWLEWAWGWLVENVTTSAVASIILIIVIILFMFFIVGGNKPVKKEEKKE